MAAVDLLGVGSMAFLSDAEKAALRTKIRQTESGTSAEIVTVIAQKSDGYRYIPLLWAALIALSIPGLYYAWFAFHTAGWLEPSQGTDHFGWLYPMQVLAFLGLGLLFQLPQARMWLIPQRVKHQRAARHAREQFFLQNLHQTQGRTGVLIFVSVAEHYVEIIVDSTIADAVDNSHWQKTVEVFVQHVRQGNIAQGFNTALDSCQDILWQHFPASSTTPDELPNHLIEV